MRTARLPAWIAPPVPRRRCGGTTKPGPVADTAIGVDETGIGSGAEIAVDPLELGLRTAGADDVVSGTFTIATVGEADLVGTITVLAGGDQYAVDTPSIDIAPGGSDTVTVTF